MKKLLPFLSILFLLTGVAIAQNVTSVSPSLNSDDVSSTSNVTINFSEAMDNSTINTSTVIISGSMRGVYSGSFGYGATSATFDPDSSFFPGEIITVVVTEGVEDSGNDPITAPFRTMFTVAVSGGGAEFTTGDKYTADGSSFTDWSITADINEDGFIDIITLVPSQNKMSVFTNDGNGSFTGPTNYTTANSFQVEAKDVNQDGSIDLITSNNNAFMMSVFINNGSGSGTFASKVDYANGSSWNGKALTTGDIDNDGDEDVLIDIIIGGSVDSVQVFTNDGDGTFTVADGISTTDGYEQIKLVDIDADEDLDFVGISPGLGQLVTYRNDGTGSFSIHTTHAATSSSYQFTLANFKSSSADIEAITVDQADDNARYFGDGVPWAFGALPSTIMVGDTPVGIASGDLDGDGHIDVVVSNAIDKNLSILMNDGSPSFTESNYSTGTSYANYISLADVDNDGDLDIVMANQDGTILVMKNYAGGNVSSVNPTYGALDIATSSDVTIKFDEAMDSGTLNASNVQVIGSLTGLHSGSYTYTSGDSTLTINPTNDFAAGEVITVVVSIGVESAIGVALERGYTSNFVVATGDGGAFGSPTNYTAGNEPKAIAMADLNGDDDMDIITANTSADSIAVLLSNGDGTFASPVHYYGGDAPTALSVGDIDGDGNLDIVSVANESSFSLLTGNGDGTLDARVTKATAAIATEISLADIDNDGDLDVTYIAGSQARRQLNDGAGNFSSEWNFSSGHTNIDPIDVDNDGDLDFLYAYSNTIFSTLVRTKTLGVNSYSSESYSLGSTPGSIATGDFNGDGYIDALVTSTGKISYFQNDGDGTFAAKVDFNTSDSGIPQDISVTDIDGDGDLDVLLAHTDNDEIVAFINNGSGSFTEDGKYSTGDNPFAILTADINGDSIMDIVSANSETDNISVLLGGKALEITSVSPSINELGISADSDINIVFNQSVESGTVTTSTVTATGSVSGSIAGSVSYDGGSNTATLDPTSDFIIGETVNVFVTTGVTTSLGTSLSSAYQYSFNVEATGGEILQSPTDIDFINNISDLKFVDFDNDGDADLVTAESGSNGGLGVYLNDGSGGYTFSDTTFSSNTDVGKIAVADFDQDGYVDAALTVESQSGFFIKVYINDQAGSFSAPVNYSYSTDYAEGVETADINLDGFPDIVATRYNADAVHVLLNDGDGTFTAQSAVTVGDGPYLSVQLFDVDSDNDLDIVTTDWDGNTISVAKNNGDGTFASHSSYNMTGSGVYTGYLASGDIDGDGDLDLVASQTDDEDDPVEGLTVFFNDGSGDFSTTSSISATAGDLELMDIEGDGDLDIILAYGGEITTLLNNGSGSFTTSAYLASAGSTYIYGIDASDIDGDGDIDLAAGSYSALHIFENGDLVNVSSTSPSANAANVTASSNIVVTFNTAMDAATFQDTSVIVSGSKSGVLSRGLSVTGSTLTINPTSDFLPGENISVTLTNDLKNTGGTALFAPSTFIFDVAVTGNGNMQFGDTLNVGTSLAVSNFIAADLDNDGDEDLVTRNNNGLVIFKNSSGTYSEFSTTAFSTIESLYPGDLDNDGDIDILIKKSSDNEVIAVENDGSGNFTLRDTTTISSSGAYHLIVEDFDNDGNLDMYYRYGAQINYVHWGNGDFSFPSSSFPTPDFNFDRITSGDVDNDGDIDIIGFGGNDSKMQVVLNNGDRSFSGGAQYSSINSPTSSFSYFSKTVDVNGDGYVDIIIPNSDGFQVILNDGDGTFASPISYPTGNYDLQSVNPYDYDGDGDIDLSFYADNDPEGTSHIFFAYNDGTGGFGNQDLFMFNNDAPDYFSGFRNDYALTDYDGDGDLDIAGSLRKSGYTTTYYIAFAENAAGASGSAPTTAASSVSISAITSSSAKISWTNGDGSRRLVVVKEGSAVDATPVDDTGYQPNPTFGSGTELGTGNFAVFGGPTSEVIVPGLDSETEYHVQVFELNGLPGAEKFYTTSAPVGNFTTSPPPIIWSKNDSTLVFTKTDYADFALEANQDRITDNLWLTRKDKRGIFNIRDEFEYDGDVSPSGTMWALGTTDNLSSLTFDTWATIHDGSPPDLVGEDMVVYIEADDLYLDINFSSWTESAEGGGFSYTRAKGPAPLVMTQTFEDSAGFALRFDNDNSYERYLEVYDDNNLLGSEFTMEAWVKLDSLGIEQGIMSLDSEVGFGITSTNTVYAYHNQPEAVSSGGGEEGPPCCEEFSASTSNLKSALTPVLTEFEGPSETVSLESTDVLAKDEWYHIALTGESGGFLKLYINGVVQDSDSVQNVGVDESYWYFGRERDRSVYLYGFMDEVRIWKSDRTASQIRSYMHRPYGGDIARLYGYWQFNEGTGTSTFDGVSNREAEFYSENSSAWFASDAPIGEGVVEETTDFQVGNTNIGNAALSMADGFDNPVDVQVTEVSGNPNQFPSGFTSGLGGKYFVINLFGDPGTFSASLTLTYGSGVITAAQQSNPALLKLYKRGSNSTGEWTEIASASSANSATGVVTWNGITAFSQFMGVADEPSFNIQITDGTKIVSYNDSTYTFADSLFDLEDGFADSLLTINSKSTLTGTLYLDQNSNGVFDSGTDSLLTADKELSYTPSGSVKLRYNSSTSGKETAVIKLQHEAGKDSVSLDFFTVEGDPSIAGNADENGWYLLSNPFTSTIGELLSAVWTQGAVNSNAPGGDATLYTFSEDSSKYVAVTTDLDTTKLAAGQGLLVYLYEDDDLGDGQSDVDGGWPKTLTNYGSPFGTEVSITARNVNHDGVEGTSGSEGFTLLGNPYGWSLSADSVISSLKREDPLANSYVYKWNAVEKTYQILASGSINPYESVFVRVITSGTTANLSFDYDDAVGVLAKSEKPEMFDLNLVHMDTERSSTFNLRNTKSAKTGIDPYDGYYLGSYANTYSNLYSVVDGQALTINNIPLGFEGDIEIPLYADATLTGDFVLNWDPETLPEEWTVTLENNSTGEIVAMNETSAYSFTMNRGKKSGSLFSEKIFSTENNLGKGKNNNTPVLTLKVVSSLSVGTENDLGIPEVVELYQNYPNPFNPSSVIRFGVPTQSKVKLEVFDILGRRVATLLNNEIKPAGRYNITFSANNLASGMYLYRLSVGNKVIVKKMTFIK